jgi:chaperonin GroEL
VSAIRQPVDQIAVRGCSSKAAPSNFGWPSRTARAKAAIGKLSNDNADIQAGINIVLRALEAPIRQIAENSGVEGSIVVGKVLENKSQTFGFDAQTEQYVDMLNAGIVDPAKVVRVALQDAASIAGLMITTEAMVAETPKKKEAPAMPGGGMGGMGGMDY